MDEIHLLTRKRYKKWKQHDTYILENKGIDAALLALDLKVSERFVIQRQRRLGIRRMTSPTDHRNPRRVQ